MESLGYRGPADPTAASLLSWLEYGGNGAWDYFCQGILRASISHCAANPFNGNTNIYDSGITWRDLWQGLKASPRIALFMAEFQALFAGALELGAGRPSGRSRRRWHGCPRIWFREYDRRRALRAGCWTQCRGSVVNSSEQLDSCSADIYVENAS